MIITRERMRVGVLGEPQPRPWRDGDPVAGMTQQESDDFKMLGGLANQLDHGSPEERKEALEGFMKLLRPGGRLDKPFPEGLPPIKRPQPRPGFEPAPEQVERAIRLRPTCKQDPYAVNCLPVR